MVEGRCMLQTLQHCPPEEGGGTVQEQPNTGQVLGTRRESDSSLTCSMFGFSKGGLPRDPSTTGWLICRMHFRSSCEDTVRHSYWQPKSRAPQER